MNSPGKFVRRVKKTVARIGGAKSVDENDLSAIGELLGSTEVLDVAYCAWAPNGVFNHVYRMDIIQAIEVFYQASDCEMSVQRRQVLRRSSRHQEMDDVLGELVSTLQAQADITFCLAWRFDGEEAAALRYSPNQTWEQAQEGMFDYLMVEFRYVLGLFGSASTVDKFVCEKGNGERTRIAPGLRRPPLKRPRRREHR